MKTYNKTLITFLALLPLLVSAETFKGTKGLISSIGEMVQYLTILAAALALLAFFWGLAKFIFRVGGDEKAVEEGKTIMKWGLIALFVMVSVWGIVGFMQSELGLPNTVNLDEKSELKPPDLKSGLSI